MQFKCEIWGLKRRFSISLLPATDMKQNSLVTSLHSPFTHDITASKEVVDKDQAHETIVKLCVTFVTES